MNYPVIRWFGVAFFLILALALIIIPVHGYRYLYQGDIVCVGQHVDVSGVLGGYTSVAYYGKYGEFIDPTYLIELPMSKKGWYDFYLDPVIFESRLGPWYKFVGNTTGIEHGNTIAFRVDSKNSCNVNLTTNVTNVTPTPTPIPIIVSPKRFDTDLQVAYGDALILPVNTKLAPPRLWLFGRVDKIYNKSYSKQTVNLSKEEIKELEPGIYTLITQFPGKNTVFEVGYSKIVTDARTIEQLTSPWVAIKPTDVFGLTPRLVLGEFKKMVTASDDSLVEYRLEVASPVIDIASIDETYDSGKDVLDVRGYTNVAKNTELTFVMDKDKQTARTIRENTYHELVKEDTPNYWRYFQVLVPIDYETIPVGKHFITVSSPQGATQTVSFDVYDMPVGQVRPNASIKYVAGNQFIPKPTAEIVTVIQTVIQTQTVFVPVTPRDDVVYAQQKKASDANYWYWVSTGATVLVVGVVLSLSGWYLIRVVKRARLR